MCGIAGIFGASNVAAVEAMLTAMLHRGPDDGGIYNNDRVTLGQRRLSIIDTSPAGHQPMPSESGEIQLVLNGEIYNFQSERAALEARGRRFRSQSDTEVALALYEAYGEQFLARLRGMFAIAVYDRRGGPGREKLLLARDQFGIKPLLYSMRGTKIVFASELKGLLASGLIARVIDSEGLRQLLSLGSVYQPRTLVEGVVALPPAHYMVAERSGVRIERYWRFDCDRIAGLRSAPYAEQVERLHRALEESVRLQMIADVPVGAFLSGGVDSSLIVSLMARATKGLVKTFSVGFETGVEAIDESHDAADIAKHLGTDHSRVLVGASEARSHFLRFVQGLDQPSVDGFNSYFVSYAAAQAVTVSLSGTGGDEVFLGYPWFAHLHNRFGTAPLSRSRGLAYLWSRITRRKDETEESCSAAAFREAFGRLYHVFGPDLAERTLAADRRAATRRRAFSEDLLGCDELVQAGALDRASVLCLNGYTRNQLLRDIDACAMTHSLEVRVPFLDPVIADFALSLPPEAKFAITGNSLEPAASYDESGVKRIVCDVARRYLPSEFFARRSKKGFTLPFASWLRGSLADLLADTLSDSSVSCSCLFDRKVSHEICDDFAAGRRPWSHPWLLLVTELWARDVLRAPATPRRAVVNS